MDMHLKDLSFGLGLPKDSQAVLCAVVMLSPESSLRIAH